MSLCPPFHRGPETFFSQQTPSLVPFRETDRKDVAWLLFFSGLFLYFISCLNVTNLVVIRFAKRQREIGIRVSLGATRSQIKLLLALDSFLLIGCTLAISAGLSSGFSRI
jgi:ABC-type antimicrobial peptide transport system permease subunit